MNTKLISREQVKALAVHGNSYAGNNRPKSVSGPGALRRARPLSPLILMYGLSAEKLL